MDFTFNITDDIPQGKYDSSSVMTAVCLILISISAVVGNLLVLAAIVIKRNLRTISDLYLANLAIADLLQAALAIPLRATVLLGMGKQQAPIPCSVVIFFTLLFGGISNISILLVSVDRFTAIKWPFKYHTWFTMKAFVGSVILSWSSMFLFAASPLVGWGRSDDPSLSPSCRFSSTLDRTYVAIGYIFIHGLPLMTIITVYFFILKASFRHSRAIAAQELSLQLNNSQLKENSFTCGELSTNGEQRRTTNGNNGHTGLPRMRMRNHVRNSGRSGKGARMIAILIGVFIILVLPIIVIDVVEMWKQSSAPPIVVNIAICLIYTNSGVNVFIYASWNAEYRRNFHRILHALWKVVTSPCS
ncbi:adenosine receptor A2b-like [Stylophora pistillata]|uniref:adenosine receptor A2b-like n=1 Tax=Stylophora pistillata TaxID=50429 RepID=UPI000C03C093|nr:adenosine receptor A2b-like [Stylophora pistillata]